MTSASNAQRTIAVVKQEVQEPPAPPVFRDALLDGLLLLCRQYNREATAGELTAGLPLLDGRLTPELLERAARRVDLNVKLSQKKIGAIAVGLLPVLLLMKGNAVAVLTKIEGDQCTYLLPEMDARPQTSTIKALQERHTGLVAFAAPLPRHDDRADDFAPDPKRHWFWGEVRRCLPDFIEVGCAAAIANLLAVATSLFSMQVYDRVVPNFAFSTLWVLTIGAAVAISIELLVRVTRSHLMDIAGRRLDLKLSSLIFGRAMGIRLEARPKSVGSFVNQVREFDSVREFFTSTTIGALSDIPFVLLFISIIFMLGGPIAWVLVAAVPMIIIPGLLAQVPLARMSRMHMKEGSVRNGLLMEAMSGAETVKALRGESRFQRLWEEYTKVLSNNSMHMRSLSSLLTYAAASVQQVAYIMVMVVGVYQVAANKMTVGALLACAILSSRTISPLTQFAQILARWQQMKVALSAAEGIMKAPVDRPAGRKFVHRPRLKGGFELEELAFRYEEEGGAALQVPALTIEAGSATALLGNNGSGKSTLLKLLAGLYHAQQGRLLLDGTDIRQIDPADVGKAVGYVPQDVRLFYGTLRENLLLGQEGHQDEVLLDALRFVGAEGLVREHPLGLDRMIGEGGSGVSGGQRQSIGLARVWLRDPRIVLMDEPTAAMDHALELKVVNNMASWLEGRTLVVATHRQPVLALARRAIVLQAGRPVADGPVEGVLTALSANRTNNSGQATRKAAEVNQ